MSAPEKTEHPVDTFKLTSMELSEAIAEWLDRKGRFEMVTEVDYHINIHAESTSKPPPDNFTLTISFQRLP